MGRVGDAEASHSVSVTPFGKMALKRLRPFVRVIAANLAVVADVQPVQFVQPIRNRLYNYKFQGEKIRKNYKIEKENNEKFQIFELENSNIIDFHLKSIRKY